MKTPTETTPQDPRGTQYAGVANRLTAFAFDYLIICGYIVMLIATTMATVKIAELVGLTWHWPGSPIIADLIALVTLVLPVVLYFTLQESSPKQGTWGKRKAGIRVVNANGGTLTRPQALLRSLVKFLPWQIAHTGLFQGLAVSTIPLAVIVGYVFVYMLVGIYTASALISKKHRTPYDWASGSYVIVDIQIGRKNSCEP